MEETFNPNRTTLLKIIEIIRKNPTITAKELTENIQNITLVGVKWNLKKNKIEKILQKNTNITLLCQKIRIKT